jgi:hypothetical protein
LVVQSIRRILNEDIPKWEGLFPGQIPTSQVVPTALPENGIFQIDGHDFIGVPVEHSDTHASTFLHVPSLRLVVGGDIVYGECFQYLAEANTAEKRQLWIKALDTIAALNPAIVVPGHKRATQADGPYLVDLTKQFILDFEKELEASSDPVKIEEAMVRRYPTRWNAYILLGSIRSSLAQKV